jgi:RNA polymerase primary sigma factor
MTAKKSAPAKAAPAAAPAKANKAEAEDKKKPAKAAAAPAKPAAKAVEAKGKPGRKPKAGAAKKEEVPEEDFSDIEADLQGEPEAEAEGGEEKVAKVKPLRMKVSRAKERALMREFGLDETALTEEEVAKRRQELKTLIKMGKTRGFLTHQEINDH